MGLKKQERFVMRITHDEKAQLDALKEYMLRDSRSDVVRYLIRRSYQAYSGDAILPEIEADFWREDR